MRLNVPWLETPRLRLRTLEPADASGPYLSWMHDPEVVRDLEVRFTKHDTASLEKYIGGALASDDNLLLGIFRRSDGRHIGNIKIGPITWRHGYGLIGLFIGDKTEWRKGYGTEAIVALRDYAFGTLKLNKVAACYLARNEGSARAFAKAGFAIEGRFARQRMTDAGWEDEIWLGSVNPALAAQPTGAPKRP